VIEHDDGTSGFYAHLKQSSAQVMVGESVTAGQVIALAGHSGTPDVPHLHFGVYATYPGVEGNDVAVNFRNTAGPVDCRGGLVWGATYTAGD
jgi:murein DD-endopeptidase MepM/ murein hydrolase activator NlpD